MCHIHNGSHFYPQKEGARGVTGAPSKFVDKCVD